MFYKDERLALFIDGSNLYAAAKALGFDIDYKLLRHEFMRRGKLLRAFYYTALLENDEYSPIRPLVDWLHYNGFSMVTRVGKGPTALYHLEWGPHYPKVPPGFLIGGPNYDNMKFLAPGAPAKALLWESPNDLESGARQGELFHWKQSDLWEGGFLPQGSYDEGWWAVTEPDIYYNMNLVWFAAEMVARQAS